MGSRVYIGVGDSISSQDLSPPGNDGYPTRYAATAIPGVDFFLHAVSGQGLLYFQGQGASIDAEYSTLKPSFLSLLQGNDNYNDYADFGGSQSTFLTQLAAWLDARRTRGFKVILCTPLPRTGTFAGTNYNIKRAQERAAMLTWVGTHCDYLCDMGADPVMGPDAAASDTTLYSDGTHPTNLGGANLAAILATVANRVGVRHRLTWTTSTGFNGGRSQTNVNSPNTGEFQFLNVMKSASAWDVEFAPGNGDVTPPNLLDAQGYPISLYANGVKNTTRVPTQAQRPGNYIATWDGTGTIGIGGGGSLLTGSATFTGSISGTTLTIPGTVTGTIKIGQRVTGGTTLPYTFITAGSGTTYTVSKSQTVAPTSLTADCGSFSSSGAAGAGFCVTSGPTDSTIGFSQVAEIIFHILAIGTPHITNIKIFHVDDAADIDAGLVFGKKFKQRLQEANFGVIRFLNWQNGNNTNVTTWATRKPVDYVYYNGFEYRSALYCTTAATRSGTAYTTTPPSGFVLADKATIHVKWADSYLPTVVTFTSGNSSILMPAHGLVIGSRLHFSLESGGALPGGFAGATKYYVVNVPDADHIRVSTTPGGTAITPSGVGSQPGQPATANPFLTLDLGAGPVDIVGDYSSWLQGNLYPFGASFRSLNTLVYDAALNAWIKYGLIGGAIAGSVGIDAGVPPELCVQLCTEVGAHPYFIAPQMAVTPMTDYIPMLAKYCKDNGPAWMIPRFEGPNELWNTGFFQTGYASVMANLYKSIDPTHWLYDGDFHNWYGKVLSTIGQAVSVVYSNDRTKYHVIGGVQTGYLDNPGSAASLAPRFTSDAYVNQTIAVQPPLTGAFGTITFTKSAASGWTTHLACAQYFTPGLVYTTAVNGTPNEADLATTYAGGGPTGAAALTTYVNSCGAYPAYGVVDFTVPKQKVFYTNGKGLAQSVGIQKMCGYEGCYSPDYTGTGSISTMRRAAKWEPALYTHTMQTLNDFVGLTGGGFVSEFPSNFIVGADYTWAILDPDIYAINSQQWDVHVAFNR
jgi:hypothetical protein